MRTDPDPSRFRELMLDEEPGFEEVLACVFGVQEHEVRTYLVLRDHPGSTVAELADALDRDRSNVNRSLSTLREKGLARRERRLLDSGGHVYQYTATPADEARELMHETLDEWAAYVHERIDEFPED
ncbi:helix-turn-helix domain-containing protein [Halorarius halobius]|uniref:helix-turn-helix domain-containing protein n=1 Tax=Halorarius halobius TaxID=2962671 RepID=UPI0020CED6BA|nr:helix-turn-helix domain-containing protein [Halorarius halobius]